MSVLKDKNAASMAISKAGKMGILSRLSHAFSVTWQSVSKRKDVSMANSPKEISESSEDFETSIRPVASLSYQTAMKLQDTKVYILHAVIKSFDLFADIYSSWWFDPSSIIAEEAARLTSPEIVEGKNKFQNVNLYAYVFALFFYNLPFCVLSHCVHVADVGIIYPSSESRPQRAEGQSGAALIIKAVKNIPCRDVNFFLI